MNIRRFTVIPFLFLLSCQVGPRYCPPAVEIPIDWKNEANQEAPHYEDVGCWWEIFQDDDLNDLEARAVLNNQNIAQAVATVKLEWALAGVTQADLFPQVVLNPSYLNQDYLVQFPIPGVTRSIRYHQKQYLVPYSLSYMLDFWRKNWDNLQAAIDTAEAQEEALRVTILTITTDLASQYFQLRSYDEQLRILDDAIKVREEAVKINGDRFRVGIASEIDLVQAQADLSAAVATKDETIRLRGLAENQIAVLTGRNASDLSLFKNPLVDAPPLVPAGLTSDLLKRRPDISEAERQMAANNEKIGVAVASFFPTITITGALGAESPDIKQLFTYPSRYWSIGTNIEQILFDGGRLVSNYSAAKAQYEQAVANYRQTVLQSFQEVEDALISIKQNREKRKALVDTSNYNQRSVQLSQNRYNNGLVNYLEVEVQMKDLLQSQLNAQQSLSDQYLSTVQLIKALGGGWCSM